MSTPTTRGHITDSDGFRVFPDPGGPPPRPIVDDRGFGRDWVDPDIDYRFIAIDYGTACDEDGDPSGLGCVKGIRSTLLLYLFIGLVLALGWAWWHFIYQGGPRP